MSEVTIFSLFMNCKSIQKTLVLAALIAAASIVISNRTSLFQKRPITPFVPTNEWKEVLPGQSIPKVRVDPIGEE